MRWKAFVAWLMWALTMALAASCLVLTRLNQLTPARYFAEFIVSSALGSIAFSTIGAMITARQPENRVGWLLNGTGVSLAGMAVMQQYTRLALVTRTYPLPGGEMLGWINMWAWVPLTALYLLYLPLLFPHGRLPSPRWRWAAWCAAAAAAALSFSIAITPGPVDDSLREVHNPFVPVWSAAVLRWLNPFGAAITLTALGAATAAPLMRMRRAHGAERAQMRIFAFGSALLALCFLIPLVIYYPNFTRDTFLSGLLLSIGIPFLPIAVGVAVLRYRLYDIEGLIRGTLVYSLLSFLLVIGYLLGVVLLQSMISSATGNTSALAIAGSTLLMAVLFQPLRTRIQRVIDRLFYRQKYEPSQVLSRFSSSMRSEVDLDRLARMLVEEVENTIQPQSVSLWLVDRRDAESRRDEESRREIQTPS